MNSNATKIVMVGGLFLLAAAFFHEGRFIVTPAMTGTSNGGAIYITDRITGEVRLCSPAGCRTLGRVPSRHAP